MKDLAARSLALGVFPLTAAGNVCVNKLAPVRSAASSFGKLRMRKKYTATFITSLMLSLSKDEAERQGP